MAFFNYVTKEITLKVVYYGPALSGKTTNLQHLYSALDPAVRGKFISLATESDRTLFFDFLPVELGRIKDFSVRFQLYTVPGQVCYNATRKLVLKGADAVVFVADSQRDMKEPNIESLMNMRENLVSNNIDPDDIPVFLQYNKRDLPNILSTDELEKDLNGRGYQSIEAVAAQGKGVEETFRRVTRILLKDMVRKHKVEISPAAEEIVPGVVPDRPLSAGGAAAIGKTLAEKAEDVVPTRKEEIFPEAKEEIVSVKIPDDAVFEINEPDMPPKAAEEQRTDSLHRKEEMSFVREEAVSVKAPDKSGIGVEEFHVRPDISEPKRVDSPFKAMTPSPSAPAFSTQQLDLLSSLAPEIKQSVAGIKESLTLLSSAVKESGKQQADMVKILREIRNTLNEAGKKKRWFDFLFR